MYAIRSYYVLGIRIKFLLRFFDLDFIIDRITAQGQQLLFKFLALPPVLLRALAILLGNTHQVLLLTQETLTLIL